MPAFIITLAVAALLGCEIQSKAKDSGALTIYYIAFDVETFLPVTVDRMESQASCVFHLSALDPSAERLREFLAYRTEDEFDHRRVRLKAMGLAKGPMFVDADGGIRDENGKEGRLEDRNFEELGRLMKELATQQGCDLYGEREMR